MSIGMPWDSGLSGSNVERAGDHNQRAILQAIRIGGPITRTELGAISGLTAPAISNITRRLQDIGLIGEFGLRTGGRGHPAMRLTVDPDGAFALGAGVDHDHLEILLVDLVGKVRRRITREIRFPLPADAADFFREARSDLLDKRSGVAIDRVCGIGLSLPGQFARILHPGQPAAFAQWADIDVESLFGERDGLPLFVENDASLAALAEAQIGHGLRAPNFFYVLINYGLGGGLVIDGQLVRGANGRCGEIGFMPLPDGRSLEQAASLASLYTALAAAGRPVEVPSALGMMDATGQAVLRDWLQRAADALASALAMVTCVLDPSMLFLGGRLPPALLDMLVLLVTQRLQGEAPRIPAVAPLRRAHAAMHAPALGGALLAIGDRLLPSPTALMKAVV